jgi:crotonobetainyl-CoA:carnitine CoA-transferase CaiB-like acyl-CoA transferase
MSDQPMRGVRVVEVAQFTFVPASGALLAEWGADVIKVEHAVNGDAQRGLTNIGPVSAVGPFAPIMEHPNHGKRSIGLALETEEGLEILHELVHRADVFSTNFLPEARARLRIDVEDLRKVNPRIIYVRGSALGSAGRERNRGGYDQSTFWCRGGNAAGVTPPELDRICTMPGPAYGDSIGGMTIAGGIAAALFARERTGEPSVVDVSLLSTSAWANALPIAQSLINGEPWQAPAAGGAAPTNPLSGLYRTSDDRWIQLSMLQPARYWADFCKHLGREDLATDERFDSAEKLMDGAEAAGEIVAAEIATRTLADWQDRFQTLEGQWEAVQNSIEVGNDPQLVDNGHIADVVDVEGTVRKLVASPVRFDESSPDLTRSPTFAEHTDEILRELGVDDERMIELKLAGAVT